MVFFIHAIYFTLGFIHMIKDTIERKERRFIAKKIIYIRRHVNSKTLWLSVEKNSWVRDKCDATLFRSYQQALRKLKKLDEEDWGINYIFGTE